MTRPLKSFHLAAPAAKVAAGGERGEDFQGYLKRQAEESARNAKETKLMAPKGLAWYAILNEKDIETDDVTDSTKSTAGNGGDIKTPSVQIVEKLRKEGASVMEGEVAQYGREENLSRADSDWFKTVMRSGTVSDRCSALTLAVQASPLHALEHLRSLGEMAKAKSRHEALLALDALRDLFTTREPQCLLPPHRKLRYMHQQPGINSAHTPELRRKCALIWYWEESLKAAYLETIRVLEIIAQDPIGHSRQRACRILYELLRANPREQDANILGLLANKLGDSERSLASRIPFYFSELVNAHPKTLTAPAIEHIRTIMDRPGIADRTRYHGLCFLIQIRLSGSTPAITASLLQIYLGLFTKYILQNLNSPSNTTKNSSESKRAKLQKRIRHKQKKRGEAVDTPPVPEEHARMAKALLTGINRAFPYAATQQALKDLLINFAKPLLALCSPGVAFPTTLQALNLLLTLAPYDQGLLQQLLSTLHRLLDQQDTLRQASASHALFIRTFTRTANLLLERNDRKALHILLKSILRFSLAIISTPFLIATLATVGNFLAKFPPLKAAINAAPESIESAKSDGSFYELIALSRHYQPRVRRYALAILKTCHLPPQPSSSDRQVIAEPFEKLSFLALLETWNRMRRTTTTTTTKKQKKNKTANSDDEEDTDNNNMLDEEPKMDHKKTDNPQVAAQLYDMDEYTFIRDYLTEKDERIAKEALEREKIILKRKLAKSQQNDDSADIDAEADLIMQEAINKQAKSAFGGNEDDDDDFAYEVSDDEDDDSEEEDDDINEDFISDNENEDEDEDEDLEALMIDSDTENFNVAISDDSEQEAEQEEQEDSRKNKKKKQKRSVFAAASDYEDALLDD